MITVWTVLNQLNSLNLSFLNLRRLGLEEGGRREHDEVRLRRRGRRVGRQGQGRERVGALVLAGRQGRRQGAHGQGRRRGLDETAGTFYRGKEMAVEIGLYN